MESEGSQDLVGCKVLCKVDYAFGFCGAVCYSLPTNLKKHSALLLLVGVEDVIVKLCEGDNFRLIMCS